MNIFKFQFIDAKSKLSDGYLAKKARSITERQQLTIINQGPSETSNEYHAIFHNHLNQYIELHMVLESFGGREHLKIDIQDSLSLYFRNPSNELYEEAYNLKIAVKDLLRNDWHECIWLVDSHSDYFAEKLYPAVYRAENSVRNFINEVMGQTKGINWWDNTVKTKIQKDAQYYQTSYLKTAPSFSDVNINLISVDTRVLTDIIKSTKSEDLWNNYFGKYLNQDFFVKFEAFCEYRNHVAHNKLIDKEAFNTISENAEEIFQTIRVASKAFRDQSPSDNQKALEQERFEKRNQLIPMDLDTVKKNFNIWGDIKIKKEFDNEVSNLICIIQERYAKETNIEIELADFTSTSTELFLTIKIPAKNYSAKFRLHTDINKKVGSKSTATVTVYISAIGGSESKYSMSFTNGIPLDKKHQNPDPLIYSPSKEPLEIEEILTHLKWNFDIHIS